AARSASAATEELGTLLATFMPAPLALYLTQNYHGNGARHTGPRSGSRPQLGRRELALGGVALFLGHGRKALALARVLALAGICGAFAGALALAGVGADALAFAGGVGCGRQGRTSQEQRGCCGGNSGTRLGRHLHDHLLQKEHP